MQSIIINILLFAITTRLTISKNIWFHEQFHQLVSAEVNESYIISPLSLRTSLTLLYLGAEGETAREIEVTLGMANGTKREHAKRYKSLIRMIMGTVRLKGEPKIHIVNRIFVRNGFSILPTYNELAKSYMNAGAENINFDAKQEAAKRINDWVGEQTEHQIDNIIHEDSIGLDTQLVLLNAIYFNASWQIPFLSRSVRRNFFLDSEHKVKVEMMRQANDYRYGNLSQLDAQAIELPYSGTDIKMLVILPNKIDGLRNLELQLKQHDIRKFRKHLDNVFLKVELPKFNISYKQPLIEILKKMGLTNIFWKANFSSLTNANGDLSVSHVEQAAVIDVNEHGTMAAAVTKTAISSRKGLPTTEITFTADHPFFFAILHFEVVLFAGRVNSF